MRLSGKGDFYKSCPHEPLYKLNSIRKLGCFRLGYEPEGDLYYNFKVAFITHVLVLPKIDYMKKITGIFCLNRLCKQKLPEKSKIP